MAVHPVRAHPGAGAGHHTALLRDLTRSLAHRLVARGARAIAATGSVGRGDARPGSDIDLTIIGRSRRAEQLRYRGAAVSLLWETRSSALSFESLCAIDVDDLWVVHDPGGVFERMRDAYRAQLQAIDQARLDDALLALLHGLEAAGAGPALMRIDALRQVAWRAAAIEVYLKRRWRMPKFRHMAEALAPQAVVLLRRIHAVPLAPASWRLAMRQAPGLGRAMGGGRGRADPTWHQRARERYAAGLREEAALTLRAEFAARFLPAARGPRRALTATGGNLREPGLGYWKRIEGLADIPPDGHRRVALEVERLLRALRTARFFTPRSVVSDLVRRVLEAG